MRHAPAILLAGLALAGCHRHEVENFDRLVQFEPPPIYCYRSLAEATCYAVPLPPNQHDRIVGYVGQPPAAYYAATPQPMPMGVAPANRPAMPPQPQPRTPVDAQPLPRGGTPPAPPPS
ncbi:MAG: hypothetical protein HYR63_27680 [Proteobacteria bacterium]|nr:hypothetical protein [Pseudomonadota bacterium]MBI3497869.1 hypothetical protein [Pseudomonadota bacterium]